MENQTIGTDGDIAAKYTSYSTLRSQTLATAREAALLTIPSLVPPESNNSSTVYPTPHQGLGARGLNNLANKLLMSLFPPNSSFFRLTIDDFEMEKLSKGEAVKAKLEEALSRVERSVTREMESTGVRVKLFEAVKALIVSGNTLIYVNPKGGLRVFPLSRYVVKRDPMGNLLDLVVKEDISPLALPEEIRKYHKVGTEVIPNMVEHLYTRVWRVADGTYKVCQELKGVKVQGSEGEYLKGLPWLALRWTALENEDYGRGFIEEHSGDLKSLEGLSKALLDGAAAAARVLFLLKPNAATNKRRLVEANNGAVIEGNPDDISTLQLEKYADFRVALEKAASIEQSLSMVFMLNSAVQRNGERVTAEEIRTMMGELDSALGGVATILAQDLQLPLATSVMAYMTTQGRLPPLPPEIKPTIITGLEALGRGQDLNKLSTLVQQLQVVGQTFGAEEIAKRVNIDDLISRIASGLGIDTLGLVKSAEEVAQIDAMQHAQAVQQAQAQEVAKASLQPQQ